MKTTIPQNAGAKAVQSIYRPEAKGSQRKVECKHAVRHATLYGYGRTRTVPTRSTNNKKKKTTNSPYPSVVQEPFNSIHPQPRRPLSISSIHLYHRYSNHKPPEPGAADRIPPMPGKPKE
jgi:hypothetical protein